MCMCVNVHIHIVITLFLWRQCEHFWWLTFLTSFLNTSIVTKGPGIKPRASHMLGRSSAIELHCSLGLSFKAGVMKTFPNMARGPVEEREVFSSDPDTILCGQHSVYQMGPCWHIVVLILPVLETMYGTCRKDFGYRQLPHTFFFSSELVLGTHMEIKVTFVWFYAAALHLIIHLFIIIIQTAKETWIMVPEEYKRKQNQIFSAASSRQANQEIASGQGNQSAKKSKSFSSLVSVRRFSSVTRERSLSLQR